MKAVELFAGAGGLALGISLAGFSTEAVIEWNKSACETIRKNKERGFPLVSSWPLHEDDVRKFDYESIGDIDLLAGGPPCQPFSLGGKHAAHEDDRDMFPAAVEAVRRLRPKAFIIENVKGLTRSAFSNYYHYIQLQFEFPEVIRKAGEDWQDHLHRLQAEKTSGKLHKGKYLTYNVVPTLANAANYGVPQRRERVFIVGFRNDLGIEWSFPDETHSADALVFCQYVKTEYWDRHEISRRKRQKRSPSAESRIALLKKNGPPSLMPWKTVRDALNGLTDPEKQDSIFPDHQYQPGARPYPGHTGSPLDLPAKTLKAGDHGVPGGENMMVKDDGSVRYFTIRESARLQTFPDGYVFGGAWTETMRQLGNAVPVQLSKVVAASVAEKLVEAEMKSRIQERAS